jgi:WD40 repeat protein
MGSTSSDKELARLRIHFKAHRKIREYQAHASKVHSVGWSCDGRRLASGSFDKCVSIFTLDRERLVRKTLDGHHFTDFTLERILYFIIIQSYVCMYSIQYMYILYSTYVLTAHNHKLITHIILYIQVTH